jgi:hypothetical protein
MSTDIEWGERVVKMTIFLVVGQFELTRALLSL